MAEGIEVEIPLSSQRYFCHVCAREVSVAHPDLTCRICQNGFVEEVAPEPDLAFDHALRFGDLPQDFPEDSDDSDSNLDIDVARVTPMMGASLDDLIRRTIRRTIIDFYDGDGESPLQDQIEGVVSILSGTRNAVSENERFPILAQISGSVGGGSFRDLFQLASNLGDYAFGGEWDAIISQILNEAEVSGPPPLDKEQIDAIPLTTIKRDHVSKALQCTICMEDFQLAEKVKNLPCDHIFHNDCIKPWLQMHATCPICRKQINAESEI